MLVMQGTGVEDLPLLRELRTETRMRGLFTALSPTAAAVAALGWRGENRTRVGEDRAKQITLGSGFSATSVTLLPGISFDLTRCLTRSRRRFRFDHRGLQTLLLLLKVPDLVIAPVHGNRVNSIETICLLLDRMTCPRKWDDLTQR